MNVNVYKIFDKEGNKAAESVTALAVRKQSVLKQVLEGTASQKKRIKNASAKCLRKISRTETKKLYPHFKLFVKLIQSDDNILKWNAIEVLGNLTEVDTKYLPADKAGKFNPNILKKYFNLLWDKSMVTAANTFRISGKVALNKPKFRKMITAELINVEALPFSRECRIILAGTAIEAFGLYIDDKKDKKEIIAFAEKNLKNKRSSTRKKAERFLTSCG